jgi:putative FmdB family regulatory protein
MPLYDYQCPGGHAFEHLAPMTDSDRHDCPACGQQSVKVPSRVSIGGRANPGLSMEQMPQTWRGTQNGNSEYLSWLRRQWGAREKLEDKYEELRGDRRPILAHEGQYHGKPLRVGDDPRASTPTDTTVGHGHGHGVGHSHGPAAAPALVDRKDPQ